MPKTLACSGAAMITLDKPHARKMALVAHHWSGKYKQVVQEINLISLLWMQGKERLPCDS